MSWGGHCHSAASCCYWGTGSGNGSDCYSRLGRVRCRSHHHCQRGQNWDRRFRSGAAGTAAAGAATAVVAATATPVIGHMIMIMIMLMCIICGLCGRT